MLGRRVIFTPKGFFVRRFVSWMASRSASGLGWVRAVRIPVNVNVNVRRRAWG
jgi:hypothetical protein